MEKRGQHFPPRASVAEGSGCQMDRVTMKSWQQIRRRTGGEGLTVPSLWQTAPHRLSWQQAALCRQSHTPPCRFSVCLPLEALERRAACVWTAGERKLGTVSSQVALVTSQQMLLAEDTSGQWPWGRRTLGAPWASLRGLNWGLWNTRTSWLQRQPALLFLFCPNPRALPADAWLPSAQVWSRKATHFPIVFFFCCLLQLRSFCFLRIFSVNL